MATTLLPLIKSSLYDLKSGNWKWSEVASTYDVADNWVACFALQKEYLVPARQLLRKLSLASDFYFFHKVISTVGRDLSLKSRAVIYMGMGVWIASLLVPCEYAPRRLQGPIKQLNKFTPHAILVSKICTCTLNFTTNAKLAVMTWVWIALSLGTYNRYDRIGWCFHHFVTVPLLSTQIYLQEGPWRYLDLVNLLQRTLRYNPTARGQFASLLPFNQELNSVITKYIL